MQHRGLALATTVSSVLTAMLFFVNLQKKIGNFGGRKLFESFCKTGIAAFVMAFVMKLMLMFTSSVIHSVAINLIAASIVGMVVYYVMLQMLRVHELTVAVEMIQRRLKKYANAYNIKFDMINAKKFSKFNYLIDFITTALEKDVPIMMLIGFNGKNMEVYYDNGSVTKGEFMYHWVTVTELIVDKDIEEAVLRCSTWGRSAYISLRDFMKFEPVCRGLLYII